MRFSTAGGLPEAALSNIDYSSSQEARACPEARLLTFSFVERCNRKRNHVPLLASISLSRSRGTRSGAKGVLASLTGFALFQGRDAGLRKTFNEIDLDGKGHITGKDLEAFASRNGLPASYAAHFANAVRATASSSSSCSGAAAGGAAGQHPQPQQQQQRRSRREESEDAELTFSMFRCFVRSREEALRRAFNLFDQDGDGRISVDDLDASLARVAVCCPQTRCIYRCPSRFAQQLHSKAAAEHGFIGFSQFRDFFLLLPQQDMMVEYWVAAGAAPELSDKVMSIGRTGEAVGAKGSPWGHLLAGAVAGATSRTATAPLETLRLAAMAGQLQSRSLAQAASDIVSSQGWQGLYRGNLLNVMRSAPQKALDFFVFDAFKRLLGDDSHLQTFLAAGLAGCTSWVALYPLEVVRSRVTVQAAVAAAAAAASSGPQRTALAAASAGAGQSGLIGALSTIIRQEGPAALYKGLGPSVAAIFPEAAITYGLHDALKKAYTRVAHEEPGVAPSLAFGVLSAFMGQLVSFPLETVSRRLQVAAAGAGGLAGAAAVARGLLAEGGPAALYRGIGAATLRLVPMACVSFGTYEAVRALIVAWEQRREDDQVKAMLHSRCVPLVLRGPDGGQEVVGRLCAPAGAQTHSLCGAMNPARCGAGVGGLQLELEPLGEGGQQQQLVLPARAPEGQCQAAQAAVATACSADGPVALVPCGAAAAVTATGVVGECGAAPAAPPVAPVAVVGGGGGCSAGGCSVACGGVAAQPCACSAIATACQTLRR